MLVKIWEIYRLYKDKKENIQKNLEKASKYLKNSYQKVGKLKIEMLSQFTRIHFQTFIDVDYTNEMGLVVPKVKPLIHETKYPAYSFIDTPIDVDRLSVVMKDTFRLLTEFAEIDSMLFHLTFYYKRISRRIVGMETVIIPNLEIMIKRIDEILEDQEQEEFVKMRKIKDLLEVETKNIENVEEGG